jgi:hypothetical protein
MLNEETIIAIAPVSLNNASGTPIEVDLSRAYGVTYELTVGATTGAISVFKVQSAPTAGGSLTDITGATLATLPGATDDNKVYAIHIDMRDRNIDLFHKVVLTEDNTGTGIYGVNARLWRKDESGGSATSRGYAAEVFA